MFQNRLIGTGYHGKLCWATWSPPGRIHHGTLNSAPREEGLAEGGFGVSFSPFYQPTEEEILYCVKLSDWWRALYPSRPSLSPSSKQASKSTISLQSSTRVHRLISEAGPDVPPHGYFDCTVEVGIQ